MKLLLASGNKKKHAEFTRILAPLGLEVVLPASVGMARSYSDGKGSCLSSP
ncbi:MAG: hypothetical protein HUU28_16875 [Planctomycetaceae bacterium]|nr:hypothetical protein [Planctomycetaceae bacterium]